MNKLPEKKRTSSHKDQTPDKKNILGCRNVIYRTLLKRKGINNPCISKVKKGIYRLFHEYPKKNHGHQKYPKTYNSNYKETRFLGTKSGFLKRY